MATPGNIGSAVIGAAAAAVGHFVFNLQAKNALMLGVFVAALCWTLYTHFAGSEKKPQKTGRAAKPKPAAKAPAPKKKAKKPATPAKKEAKKTGPTESSEEQDESPAPVVAAPVARAPAPVVKSAAAKAPAPVIKAPAPKAQATAAPASKAPAAKAPAAAAKGAAPAPKASPKAAGTASPKAAGAPTEPKKKKDKKPKDSSGSPSAAAAPAAPPVFEPFEGGDEDGGWTQVPITVPKKRPPKKAAESDKGAPAPVEKTEVKVASKHLGTIIGKNGANLQAIQKECGVSINVPRDKDGRKPSNKEEIVTISVEGGSTETRQSARGAIEQLVNKGYSRITHGPDYTQQTFTVDSKKVGAIIGRKGETIREISKLSGATVNMETDSNSITVAGTRVAIAEARRLIDSIIANGYLLPVGAERAEVPVPKSQLGRLIGPKGVNTRRIQTLTNTKIIVPGSDADNQNVVVMGLRRDVARAIEEINACLAAAADKGAEETKAPDMSEWTAPVSADDAWDADEAAAAAGPTTDGGWASLAPQPGSAW